MSSPLIGLAPMEGVLDPLLRKIISQHSQIDFCTTEFVRVTDKIIPASTFYRYAPEILNGSHTESGTPVLLQLLGGKEEPMAENAYEALRLGAYGVDLNFGCPARNVNRHDGGATLLKEPQRIYKILKAIRKKVGDLAHVSAKVRLGFHDKTQALDIAKACSDGGATWLTVHARTKEEGYRPPAHWHHIKKMKEVSQIPVFANGDIWSLEDYKACEQESSCSDVMIGRGLLRNPFLAQEIKEHKKLHVEDVHQRLIKLMQIYLENASGLYGEQVATGRIKQWLKMAAYPEQKIFKDLFHKVKTFGTKEEMLILLKEKSLRPK